MGEMNMPIDRRFFESMMAQKKLSLRSLASRMGLQHSQLSLTFSGSRRMQLDEAAKLAEIFSVPIQRIATAAGVANERMTGRRVDVVGVMRAGGVVELYDDGIVEKALAPEGLPEDAIAVQARTARTADAWLDGMVFFTTRSQMVEPDAVGRFCFAQIDGGPAVMATISRGYREGTYNLSGPCTRESERLAWAAPVVLART